MFLFKKENWITEIYRYIVYIFLVTFPFVNYTSFLYLGSSTRAINLIMMSSVLMVLTGIAMFRKEKVIFLNLGLTVSLFGYIAFMFLSAFINDNFVTSFYSNITRMTGLWYIVCLGFFVQVLINIFRDSKERRRAISLVVYSGALFSVLSLFGPEGFNLIFKTLTWDGFTFGNSTFAGMYLFGTFLFSVYLLLSAQSKRWWNFLLPVLIVLNPYILSIKSTEGVGLLRFIGEARASAVVLFASIMVWIAVWLVSKIKTQKIKKYFAFGSFYLFFVILCVGALSLFSENGTLRNLYLSQATSGRTLVWEMSSKLIGEKPILGWGTENFEKVFERHYDNRILTREFGGEPWFDRAHNIFIDQTFDNGLLGLVLYLCIYIVLGHTLLRVVFVSKDKDHKLLALTLIVYSTLHLVELQTSFDTSISFIILALVLALTYTLSRENRDEEKIIEQKVVSQWVLYVAGSLFALFGIWSLVYGAFPFLSSGVVNGTIRTVGSAEKRLPFYDTLFATPVDKQAFLWRTLTDFQRGVSENPKVLEDPRKVEFLKQELALFEAEYKKYTEENPNNFRALLNYADSKIYAMLFGVNKLDEAQVILDRAIALVPQAPQPYWMKAVAYLYMQKFDKAREYAQKALDLNPDIVGSQELHKYIEDSIKTFPEIELYFFRQI